MKSLVSIVIWVLSMLSVFLLLNLYYKWIKLTGSPIGDASVGIGLAFLGFYLSRLWRKLWEQQTADAGTVVESQLPWLQEAIILQLPGRGKGELVGYDLLNSLKNLHGFIASIEFSSALDDLMEKNLIFRLEDNTSVDHRFAYRLTDKGFDLREEIQKEK